METQRGMTLRWYALDGVRNEQDRTTSLEWRCVLKRIELTTRDVGNGGRIIVLQGELSLEQLLFLRPVAGWARYRTPVRDLWMCGSGTHPGGGIMGASGQLAAAAILGAG